MQTPDEHEHILVPVPVGYVLMPVSVDRLAEVQALLGEAPAVGSSGPGEPAARAGADASTSADPRDAAWTADELEELVAGAQPKQLVFLRALSDRAGQPVPADDVRAALEASGLLTSQYSGKALGGVVLSLKRRAKWWRDQALFHEHWDPEAWVKSYSLDPEYEETIIASIARVRPEI